MATAKKPEAKEAKSTTTPKKSPAPAAKPTAPPKPAPATTGGRLEAGQKAPPFSLPDQDGKTVSLADFKGKKVVLYFYPKDDTPGCTREACGFQENHVAIKQKGAVVLGVSRDGANAHVKFRTKYNLGFPLLSDPGLAVHRAYGAYGEKTMYGKKVEGVLRTTVVIDGDGKVARVFPSVKVDGHVEKVLAAL